MLPTHQSQDGQRPQSEHIRERQHHQTNARKRSCCRPPRHRQARWRDAGRQRHPAEEREEASRDVAGAMTSTGAVGAPSTGARPRGRPSGNAILALSAKGPRTSFPPWTNGHDVTHSTFDRSRQRVSSEHRAENKTRPCYRGRNAHNSVPTVHSESRTNQSGRNVKRTCAPLDVRRASASFYYAGQNKTVPG